MIPKSLKFYLDEIKNVRKEGFVLREAIPFNVLISSLIKPNVDSASVVETYLDTLKFPFGCNSSYVFQRKKETYLPMVSIPVSKGTLSTELDIFTKAAYQLLNTDVSEIRPCIEIALMEIFNNIMSHSNANNIRYLAQRWKDEKLEFAIYDDGIGFKHSLEAESEKDAINSAVFKKKSSTENENRGWGIQTLKVLVLNEEIKGEFLLISNDSYCLISKTENGIEKQVGSLGFSINGSMIVLRMNNLTQSDFDNIYDIMLEPDSYVSSNNLLDL